MQTDNRILDDLARVAGGAFGTLNDVRVELENLFKQRLERVLSDLDVVPRDEFDAVKAMAEKARTAQEALEKRVAALEAALAVKAKDTPSDKKPAAPKPRRPRSTATKAK
jgi:BMFP domain-containing protein YqiC